MLGPLFTRTSLVLILIALCAGLAEARTPFRWKLTQRLRDNVVGQPYFNYSDSIHSFGKTVAIGTTSYNRGRGHVTLLYDAGMGLQFLARLTDPSGTVGDKFGSQVFLFKARGLLHLAVTAAKKGSDGAVFLYRQKHNRKDLWEYQATYYKPTGTFVIDFGRKLHFDGVNFLINAERRYVSGPRFQVSAINWRGTSYFQQTDGVSPMAGDPVFVYKLVEQRNNGTTFLLAQTLADAPYTLDAGKSLDTSGDTLAIGGSFREALKYGHGTDGDLVVTGLYLLDGTAEYNFNSVVIKNGGTLTVGRFDAITASGGRLQMRIKTELRIETGGAINLTAFGYPGGATSFTGGQQPEKGTGSGGGLPATSTFTGVMSCDYDGSSSVNVLQVGGPQLSSVGRPANSTLPWAEACGGGGSYGSVGEPGTTVYCGTSGPAGSTYGYPLLNETDLGSGGGSGHPWKVGSGGAGGNGGGSVVIYAKRITNYGTIEANGGHGSPGGFYSGGGGGGSGGSVALVGDNLANYGSIFAYGGRGGERAYSSGFGGDLTAKGGNGGFGRIRFDFLTTQSHGHVVPFPKNITTYLGDVLIYKRNNATLLWDFFSYVPRLSGMMFVGHQVALSGTHLVVASDQGTPVTPVQRVYLFDIATLANSTSTLPYTSFAPPTPTDEKFGWKLALNNNTLIIGAEGSSIARGAVYVYQSHNLLLHTEHITPLMSQNPKPNDYFGNVLHFAYPNIFVQLPFWQDDGLPVTSRLSAGNIHLYKWVRNVTASTSFVDCEFQTITVNNTVNCTVHLRSGDGFPTGDLDELLYLNSPVDFQSQGVYTFQRSFTTAGTYTIGMSHKNIALKSFSLRVTAPVNPLLTNMTCTPHVVLSGGLVTCVIRTNAGSGEAIAAREFDIHVYHMEDAAKTVNGSRIYTSHALQYLDMPSHFLVSDTLRTDYPTQFPQVIYKAPGFFEFSYRPWLPGFFAAFGMYKREALRFPNPVIVQATPAPIAPTQSAIHCPANVAPNRTYTCVIEFKDANGFRTGDSAWAAGYVNASVINATVVSSSHVANGTVFTPVYAWWSGEGRVTVVWNISVPGTVTLAYKASYQGTPLQVFTQTTVAYTFPRVCGTYPELDMYISVFEANMYLDIDTRRFGSWVESRAYRGYDTSWCDEPRI